MNKVKKDMNNEEIIKQIIINVKLSIHNIKLLHRFLEEYIFKKLKLPINLINYRLSKSLAKGDATHLIEDLNMYLITLPILILNRIHNFLTYIITNRTNPNLCIMVYYYKN